MVILNYQEIDRGLSLNHRVQCICITHKCLNPSSKEVLIVSVFHKYPYDLFGPILCGLISQVFITFLLLMTSSFSFCLVSIVYFYLFYIYFRSNQTNRKHSSRIRTARSPTELASVGIDQMSALVGAGQ